MSPAIPTIDLTLPRLAVVEFIRTACLTHGFFQIISHQFPPLLQRTVFEYSRRLFALSTAEKTSFKRPEHNYSGYEAFQSYSLQSTRGTPDLNEGFGIASVFYDDASRWPAETPGNGLIGFKACCRQYHSAMEELAKTLAGYVAEGLELDKGYFEDYFFRPMTQVRLIHYFVDDQEGDTDDGGKQRIGAGLHSDWGLLTVLSQDDVGGLEVYDPNSESFIPVRVVCIVCPALWFGILLVAGIFFNLRSKTSFVDRTDVPGPPSPRCICRERR